MMDVVAADGDVKVAGVPEGSVVGVSSDVGVGERVCVEVVADDGG